MVACLRPAGTSPVSRLLFMKARMRGLMVEKTSLKRREGMESEGQYVGLKRETTLDMSEDDMGRKAYKWLAERLITE